MMTGSTTRPPSVLRDPPTIMASKRSKVISSAVLPMSNTTKRVCGRQ